MKSSSSWEFIIAGSHPEPRSVWVEGIQFPNNEKTRSNMCMLGYIFLANQHAVLPGTTNMTAIQSIKIKGRSSDF